MVSEVTSRVFIVGGSDADGTLLPTVQAYNARLATIVSGTKTAMPAPRVLFGTGAVPTTGQIFVFGGKDSGGSPRGEIFEFSTQVDGPVAGPAGNPSGRWTTVAASLTGRSGLATSTPVSVPPLLPPRNKGRSDDWDAIEAYIKTIRTPQAPVSAADAAAINGRVLFAQAGLVQPGFSCASCHGGSKWTRSTVDYSTPPSASPTIGTGDENVAGFQISATLTQGNLVSRNVGTYNLAGSVNELRQNASDVRTYNIALSSGGFNIPSLLGVHATAPYFHSGRARTLEEVLDGTADGTGGSRQHLVASAADRADLAAFLRSIDDTTPPIAFSSAGPGQFVSLAIDAPNHLFQMHASGTPNQVYTVEKSGDLLDWETLRSYNTGPTGTFAPVDWYFPELFPHQFYRFGIR